MEFNLAEIAIMNRKRTSNHQKALPAERLTPPFCTRELNLKRETNWQTPESFAC